MSKNQKNRVARSAFRDEPLEGLSATTGGASFRRRRSR